MNYITELKPDMHGMKISCVLGDNRTKVSIGQIAYKGSANSYSIVQNVINGDGERKIEYKYSWYCGTGIKKSLEMYSVDNIICTDNRSRYNKYHKNNNISHIIDKSGSLKATTETDSNSVKLLTKSKFVTINQNE